MKTKLMKKLFLLTAAASGMIPEFARASDLTGSTTALDNLLKNGLFPLAMDGTALGGVGLVGYNSYAFYQKHKQDQPGGGAHVIGIAVGSMMAGIGGYLGMVQGTTLAGSGDGGTSYTQLRQ